MGFKLIAGIANTDHRPLLMLQSMYGGDLNISTRCDLNPNHKPVYAWKVTARDTIKAFLSSIEPFSLVKRDQILIALKYVETMEEPGKRLQQGAWDIRLKCYEGMQTLNKRGVGQGHNRDIPISPSLGWNPAHRGLSKEDLNKAAAHMRSHMGKG